MVPAILAHVGLPILVQAVGKVLGKVDNAKAQDAAKLLSEVYDAVKNREITPESVSNANRHLEKMEELETELSVKALREINETMRAELAAEDRFVRRWRPAFGYAVAFAWTLNMGAIAWVMVMTPKEAPEIISALFSTSPLWAVALGVLGVSVVKRSQDKALSRKV